MRRSRLTCMFAERHEIDAGSRLPLQAHHSRVDRRTHGQMADRNCEISAHVRTSERWQTRTICLPRHSRLPPYDLSNPIMSMHAFCRPLIIRLGLLLAEGDGEGVGQLLPLFRQPHSASPGTYSHFAGSKHTESRPAWRGPCDPTALCIGPRIIESYHLVQLLFFSR